MKILNITLAVAALTFSVPATPVLAGHGPVTLSDCGEMTTMRQVKQCFRQIKQHGKRHNKNERQVCKAAKKTSIAECQLILDRSVRRDCKKAARQEFRGCS